MEHEQLLSHLIEIRSYSNEEEALRDYIKSWFSERNIKATEQGKNLVVHLKGEDPTRAFIFNSHMDTVSSDDEALWKYGPWTPTKVGNKIVGLGASDMKSGLATSMLLAEEIAAQGKPAVDMWFTYVAMEEVDGSGTSSFGQWFEKRGYTTKYRDVAAIFTEPTGLSHIEIGHRGNLFVMAKMLGESGHASQPWKNEKHAVYEMVDFARQLEHQMTKWSKQYPHDIFKSGQSVGAMTSIMAGVNSELDKKGRFIGWKPQSVNKFPSVCWATFDVRTSPGFHEVAWEKLQEFAQKYGVELSLVADPSPYGYTDANEKIVRVAKDAAGGAELIVADWATDLGSLIGYGVKGIILGPGESDQAHKPNEYCYPDQIIQALKIYKEIVDAWAK